MPVPVPDTFLVYVLTVFSVVVVAATRWVLSPSRAGGHGHGVSPGLLNVHTAAGVVGAVLWCGFLSLPFDGETWHSLIGVLGLGGWWITGWFGLLLLGRWLPSRGRHSDAQDHGWVLPFVVALVGHVGVALSAVVFTLGYLFATV
ncbi:hypothetical protein RDV89_13240 [Nocardioides zeae]|uniref:Uncharacterized protein n=1 Tax=Nocardioides imazamoxiresistens TaxID=3231893 RepID=A0ABU3PXS8_9ACTN|nr:hypothetical protein [Nocardioides zeae]MDT9594041.1 hypothetical protein [Nocardioides zeae]